MKRILIVEDEKSIAELERDYLEMSGFITEICSDGIEAIKLIKGNIYDLIILDVMLPSIDGLEILKRVRDISLIPIILVSAKKEEIDKIRGLNLGADDYITKPFSPSELVARVNAHISKYERIINKFDNSNNSIIEIRGISIDKSSRRVLVNNREVFLAQKEFEILLYLAQNPNRVFGREELFEKIWGLDSLGDVATVTVHIARLREKIEVNSSNPQYIETVWGAGYRFKV